MVVVPVFFKLSVDLEATEDDDAVDDLTPLLTLSFGVDVDMSGLIVDRVAAVVFFAATPPPEPPPPPTPRFGVEERVLPEEEEDESFFSSPSPKLEDKSEESLEEVISADTVAEEEVEVEERSSFLQQ